MTEAELWKLKQDGSETARNALVEKYLPLVSRTRTRATRGAPAALWEDMEGAGRIGLIRAVDRFDPAKGREFRSWAIFCIRKAMIEYLRTDDWVPRSVRRKIRAGEEVDLVEVVSLDELRWNEEGEWVEESIPSPDPLPGEEVLERWEREVIRSLVACLPLAERTVVQSHFWEGASFKTISHRFGLSESRVHQLFRRAACLLARDLATYAGP